MILLVPVDNSPLQKEREGVCIQNCSVYRSHRPNHDGHPIIGGVVGAAKGIVTGNLTGNQLWKCYTAGAIGGATIGAYTPV